MDELFTAAVKIIYRAVSQSWPSLLKPLSATASDRPRVARRGQPSPATPPTTHGNQGAIITPRNFRAQRSEKSGNRCLQSILTVGPHCHVPSDTECVKNVSTDVNHEGVGSKPTG